MVKSIVPSYLNPKIIKIIPLITKRNEKAAFILKTVYSFFVSSVIEEGSIFLFNCNLLKLEPLFKKKDIDHLLKEPSSICVTNAREFFSLTT